MSRLADASPFEVTVEDGCTLRGWRHGTASERPPILFVHGLGSSSIDWDESVDYFALAGRQVLTIDLRGHGQSDKGPRPLPVERHAADLLAALDHLGLDSLELVGLSLGGQIALELVACAPRRFRNLAVACCALDTRRHRPRVLAQWITRSIVLHGLGLSSSTRVLAKKLFPKPEQDQLRRDFEEQWLENDVTAYRAALQGAFGWNARGRLGEFEGRALILGADRDFIPRSELEAIRGELRNAQVQIVEDCGHAIPAERPTEWKRLLAEFLNDPVSSEGE